METIVEIKIDLVKLQRLDRDFDNYHVQSEVAYQLGHTGTFVITYKNGTPVKNSPNTRGLDFWIGKTLFRAIAIEAYKVFKPTSYNVIKADYIIGDDTDDDEYPEIDQADKLPLRLNVPEDGFGSLSGKLKDQADKLDKIEQLLTANKSSVPEDQIVSKEDLAVVFKCLICHESRPKKYWSCFFCGIFLGCFACADKLDKCPICRTEFKCRVCTVKMVKHPLMLPGIEQFIPEAPPISPLNIDTDSDSDESNDILPTAINN